LAVSLGAHGAIAIIGGSTLPARPSDAELEAFVDELLERVERSGSCSLDLVERHPSGMTLEQIGLAFGVTRERVRQLERKALLAFAPRVRRRLGGSITEADIAGPNMEPRL